MINTENISWSYREVTISKKALKLRKEEGCKPTNKGKMHKNSLFGLSVSFYLQNCMCETLERTFANEFLLEKNEGMCVM